MAVDWRQIGIDIENTRQVGRHHKIYYAHLELVLLIRGKWRVARQIKLSFR